jgi:hypothetical protein
VPPTPIALITLLALLPITMVAQEPASPLPAVAADTVRQPLTFRAPPAAVLDTLVHAAILRAPWVVPGRLTPWSARFAFDSTLAARVAARSRALATQRRLVALMPPDSTARAAEDRGLFGLRRQVADITFEGQLRLEVATSRQRNLACTPLLLQDPLSGCRGGFTAPKIDNILNFEARGAIGQRFFLDFNLDTQADYGSNKNIIRAWYQGLPDEVVKRVEVGTTTFRAPRSRYLTAGIPSNNFGINATFEVGPLELQAIAATQKGSNVALRTYNIGSTTVQPQDRKARDLDFEGGRFFWTVDPRTLPGWPAVDILNAENVAIAAASRPVELRVYQYVPTAPGEGGQYDGITATGINGAEQAGPFRWKPLVAGRDFWADPSGLWFVLASRIGPSDFLAVSYRTATGGTVGTFPSDDNPARGDQLLLVSAPNRAATSPVFLHAMRQIYRVAGGDLVRNTTKAALTVARSERPIGGTGTYLALLGMAFPTDQALLDTDNRLFPRLRDPGADQVIRDVFMIFPNAQPFADPQLTTSERNDSLYRTPEYLLSTQGPPAKFEVRLQYDARGGEDRGSIMLGSVQLREESEILEVDGRTLKRGVDYNIEYQTGKVSFLNPDGLFGNRQSTVTARFEERAFFAVAPTTIAGLTAKWQVGRVGTVEALGLYQAEATAYNRPPLGFEPTASLIGGAVADFRFNVPSVGRFLNRLTGRNSSASSSLGLTAELAFSRPDPNRSGEAFLEEFENDGARQLSLAELAWIPGSRPKSTSGVESLGLGSSFDLADAVQVVWQNLIPNGKGGVIEIGPQDIDTLIATTSSRVRALETVLYMTFHADTAGGKVDFSNKAHWSQPRRDFRPRWRTLTTSLSPTGLDISRNEALEFWVYEGETRPTRTSGMRLVLDFGNVSEDAVSLAPESFTVTGSDTIFVGRQYVGTGKLNTERSAFGSFNARTDDNGILGDRPDTLRGPDGAIVEKLALCSQRLSDEVAVFPWGDLGARCSNGNGGLDGEDLDDDLVLDALGPNDNVYRFVVDLSDPKYLVRDRAVSDAQGRPAYWTLYRIPLRTPDATIGSPDLRLVKQLRVGFVTPPDQGLSDPVIRFGLARMRLTGAPWIRRSDRPIANIAGATAEPRGEVLVSSISTENIELGYVSPPGVRNGPSTITANTGSVVQQVNEKSLRIIARDLRLGERAEAFTRLPAGSQTLQAYREVRVWFRGRGTGWENGQLQAFVKVGTDASNFYLFRAPARTTTWEPEAIVDLERWRLLRAELEQRVLANEAPSGAAECGGDPTAYVICDGPYLVHIRDPRVSPPNLGAIQELSTGFYRTVAGAPITETELWIDDIRITKPVAETGVAAALGAHLDASDVASIDLAYTYVDGRFRQIGQTPSYRTTGGFAAFATIQLDRFLPPRLGLTIPFQISHSSGRVDPQLLTGTDIPASALQGLRRPQNHATSWNLSLRRLAPSQTSRLMRLLVDPLAFAAAGTGASTVTELSDASSSLWNASVGYFLSSSSRGRSLGLAGLRRWLPKWLAESEAAQGIANGRIAPWPTSLRFGSTLSRSVSDFTSYSVPLERASDTLLRPVTSLQHLWRNDAAIGWQPIGMLAVTGSWQSTRDLRRYADSTALGRLAGASRRVFAGMDVGVERDRALTSSVNLTPRFTSWLRPRLGTTSNFLLSRSLTSRNPVRVLGDTAGAYILPQTVNNSRTIEFGVSVDPAMLSRRLLGDSSRASRWFSRMRPIEVSRRRTRQSTYDLATFDPGMDYQLGLGGFTDFLTRNGTRATGALDALEITASSTLDFPLGLSATLQFAQSESDRYQRLQAAGFLVTSARTTEWPSGTFAFTRSMTRGPLLMLYTSTTVRKQTADARNPLLAGAGSTRVYTETSAFEPNITLTFRGNLSVVGRSTSERGITEANGNITRLDNRRYSGSVDWSVALPAMLSAIRKPLRSQLTVTRLTNLSCLERVDEGCTPYSDVRQWEVRGGLNTDLRGSIQTGLQVGWTLNDVRHLQRKSSNLALSLFFSMPLSSEDFK